MMENMDISCGEVDNGNESAMSVDEAMDVCSDYENSIVRESTFSVNATVPNPNYSPDSTSNNATSENEDSANTTVVINSSFPNQQESASDGAEKITRFPLGIAKECNKSRTSLHNSMERIKSNIIINAISDEMRPTGKENICVNPSDYQALEFPAEAKHHSDKFPLDRDEPASTLSVPTFVQPEEEHFTSASDYIFSAADFDCLLSRGSSQAVTAAVTSSAASLTEERTADLPRDSVLINFDPLLRRQTIAKADNSYSTENLATSSACLALVEFAQQQEKQQQEPQLVENPFDSTPPLPLPLFDKDEVDPEVISPEKDLLSVTLVSTEVTIEQLNGTLTTSESGSETELKPSRQIVDASPSNALDKTGIESVPVYDFANVVLQQENRSASPFKPAELLLVAGVSVEQDFLERFNSEKQYIEQLFTQTDIPEAEHVEKTILHQPTDTHVELCENILSYDSILQQENLKKTADSSAAVLSASNASSDTESNKDIDSIAEFANISAERDALILSSKMLAEPLPEKQNSTVHNMSDDRMAQHEDENVGTAKKSRSEDINIADMEKKMHDVELREESMLKRITEKDKTISKMSNVVEAYERTIAELISEKEMVIRNHDLECESLKQDNEINAQHLESLEKTFSNLYAKYERMKKNAMKYKEHEEKLLEKVTKLEECLRAQEQRYEKMKSHAMSQLEIANTKIEEAIRNHTQESAKLKAQIKKEELYRISVNEQLIQKSKENEELVKICDELISETN